MIRVGSQLTLCSPDKILRRTVVEQDERNMITGIFNLDDLNVEPSNTLFFDGILSAEIISLKQHIPIERIAEKLRNYQYLDLSTDNSLSGFIRSKKPLIIDPGTDSIEKLNSQFSRLVGVLSDCSIYEVIAACTYYPALLLEIPCELAVNRITGLLLWENVDLLNKKLAVDTCVLEISRDKTVY